MGVLPSPLFVSNYCQLQRRQQFGRVYWSVIGLTIWQSRVRFLLWPLAGFVLNCSKFKSSATLVNSQLLQPVGVFNPDMFYLHHLFQNYRIYSINRPGRLLNFWTLRVGVYSRWALIRGWALIKFSPFSATEVCLFCNKTINGNNKTRRSNKARFLSNTLKKTPSSGKSVIRIYSLKWVGWG